MQELRNIKADNKVIGHCIREDNIGFVLKGIFKLNNIYIFNFTITFVLFVKENMRLLLLQEDFNGVVKFLYSVIIPDKL